MFWNLRAIAVSTEPKSVGIVNDGGGRLIDENSAGLENPAFRIQAQSARWSRVARNWIFGQRSIVSSRFTRDGARYTSAPE